VMEPRNSYSCGPEDIPQGSTEGKADGLQAPEGNSPGCAMAVHRTPLGFESGVCLHSGNSGTWESHLSPCFIPGVGDQVTKNPGVTGSFRLSTSLFERPRMMEASKVSGNERQVKNPEMGTLAAIVAHCTEESGEVRRKRPTGGKAPSGRAAAGRGQRRDFELTNPDHRGPGDWGARQVLAGAAEALPEEQDALIAHVPVYGGAGWVTTGSTRQPPRKHPHTVHA